MYARSSIKHLMVKNIHFHCVTATEETFQIYVTPVLTLHKYKLLLLSVGAPDLHQIMLLGQSGYTFKSCQVMYGC